MSRRQTTLSAGHSGAIGYPRNCWWVAGFCDEITDQPVERRMLDRSVLLYRTGDGRAVALENRCPHRWAPLSKGKRIGDDIQCGYHGLRFGPDGRCVAIPTQSHIPASCRVHAYPVIESQPFVWIWMGDPARIGEADPPQVLDWYRDPRFMPFSGLMEWDANYMMLHENVLDLSHFGFVHAETFGIFDVTTPPEVTTTDTQVKMRHDYPDRALPPIYTMPFGLEADRRAHFVTDATFISPALHIATETVAPIDRRPGEQAEYYIHVAHATTPISIDKMRYYFVAAMGNGANLPPSAPDLPRPLSQMKQHEGPSPPAFIEDKVMIESIQALLQFDSRGGDYPELSVRADTAGIMARRIVAAMLARE